MPRLVFRSLAMGRPPFGLRSSRLGGDGRVDGPSLLRRAVQGVDHTRLVERVLAPEQRLALAAHGGLEVGELERVGVGAPRLDALRGAVRAPDLDDGLAAV